MEASSGIQPETIGCQSVDEATNGVPIPIVDGVLSLLESTSFGGVGPVLRNQEFKGSPESP